MLQTDPDMVRRLFDEGAIPLSRLARQMHTTRGNRVHTTTLVRWAIRGKRGVRLEAYFGPGGTWWSSPQAMARFLACLTACELNQQPPESASREQAERQRRAREAEEEIRKLKQKMGR